MSDRFAKTLRVFVRSAVFILVLLSAIAPASAQKRKERALPPAPPPVIPREIRVEYGETVTIPLGIHGTRPGQLDFLVRIPPKRGKLSRVTPTGLNSAQVTYTAPKDGEEDRFTYAVRSREGVSAQALVSITFVPRPVVPPRLVAPESLEFPTVVVGQRSTALVDVENKGGGFAQGEIAVSAPWSVEGSPAYRLGPGARTSFKLVFDPDKAGDFKGAATLGPEPRHAIALTGVAQTIFVVTPERLKLHAPIGGQTRKAILAIENRSDDPRSVAFTSGGRVMTEQSINVPAKTKVDVPVFADPDDPTGFEDKLRIASGDWSTEVPVEVGALAPQVKFSVDPQSPARVNDGKRVELSAVLENRGGQPASVKIKAEPPFEVLDKELTLPARGKAPVRIAASMLPPGLQGAVLHAAGEGISETFTVKVEVAEAPSASPGPAPQPTGKPETPQTPEAEPARPSGSSMNWTSSMGREERPNALGDFVKDVKPEHATLSWPASLGPVENLSIEERRIAPAKDGGLSVTWLPLPGVTIDTASDPRRVELPRLEPEHIYTVRVRTGDQTLFTSQFITPKKPSWYPFGWQSTTITLIILTFGGFLWWRWKKQVKSNW